MPVGRAQDHKALDNQTVMDMLSMGLSDDVVVEKIHAAPATNFDTGLDALKTLKAAKVPDSVIKAMINPKAAAMPAYAVMPPVESSLPPGFPANALAAYKRPDGTFLALQFCSGSGAKTKGWMTTMVNPFGKVKEYTVYRGAEASIRIKEPRPVFYLKLAGVANARDLSIGRLIKKDNHREGLASSVSAFDASYGAQNKSRIEVTVANVTDSVISVIPKEDLAPGEYILATDEVAYQVYDFGIDNK